MVKKKDKVRFSTIVLILLFIGLLVFGCFYLSFQIEQNFVKPIPSTLGITKEDLIFIDVFWEVYKFPGCDRAILESQQYQSVGIPHNINYLDKHTCNYYVDGSIVIPEEGGNHISGIEIYSSHSFRICCKDSFGNEVCKSKQLRSYC